MRKACYGQDLHAWRLHCCLAESCPAHSSFALAKNPATGKQSLDETMKYLEDESLSSNMVCKQCTTTPQSLSKYGGNSGNFSYEDVRGNAAGSTHCPQFVDVYRQVYDTTWTNTQSAPSNACILLPHSLFCKQTQLEECNAECAKWSHGHVDGPQPMDYPPTCAWVQEDPSSAYRDVYTPGFYKCMAATNIPTITDGAKKSYPSSKS